ncbi:glucose inhibited division protein B [Bdellovibrio bacteriovorus W]|nr:glucose inhibited division protein B [Bdellovibrio bacteriovorus W]
MENSSEQSAPTIHWRLQEWFQDIDLHTQAQLKTFQEELIKANRTISLIGPKTVFFADAIHFSDSILGYRTIVQSHSLAGDIFCVGTGSGFPGIVISILDPQKKVIILESDSRKIEFLNSVINSLKLTNTSVLNKSLDQMADGSVQTVIARGFGSISKAIMLGRKSVAKGGVFFHFKGEEWGVELSEIPTQLCSLWSPSLVGDYKLPIGNMKFSVIKTDKIG